MAACSPIRDNAEHAGAMRAHGIQPIDLLVVNLYPFEATVANGADFETCIENIDIGGPAMIRAAAKNHADVAVVVDAERLCARCSPSSPQHGGATTLALRASSPPRPMPAPPPMTPRSPTGSPTQLADPAPAFRAFGGSLVEALRYGENPHQIGGVLPHARAAPRRRHRAAGAGQAALLQQHQRHRRRLRMRRRVRSRRAPPPASSSSTPIRAASPRARACVEAYRKALACDPVSAFGGIVALNRPLDAEAARAITEIFTEVIIAPDASEEAIAIVGAKKNLRLLLAGGLPDPRAPGLTVKSVAGGLLVQSRDNAVVDDMTLKVVTRRAPTNAELADLAFAFRVAKHVKSNTIVYAKDRATVGIGAGQMSRVDSARIAARKAEDAAKAAGLPAPLTKGSVVASDAFFPFADGLLVAIEAGATAVIQPGGSMRDDEVIKAADDHGIAMVFTGHAAFPALVSRVVTHTRCHHPRKRMIQQSPPLTRTADSLQGPTQVTGCPPARA